MIDLHNHLLGEEGTEGSLEEALRLCEQAQREGVKQIVVTLRMPNEQRLDRARAESYEQRWQELHAHAPAELKLKRGCEWTVSADLPERLRHFAGSPTIDESRYLLLRLPSLQIPDDCGQTVTQLLDDGYVPILAHPECSRAVRRQSSIIAHLIKLGALVQLDALSILGGYGVEAERFAHWLLERGQAHFIASRADQRARRDASLSAACERAGRIIGRSAAHCLVAENPHTVLANEPIADLHPQGRRLPVFKAALSSWG